MSFPEDQMEELRQMCPGATPMSDGPHHFVFLPDLRVESDGKSLKLDALLCPGSRDGYATRLFLAQPIPSKGTNWSVHQILGRAWHTWSWKDVPSSLRLAEILALHQRPLR